MTTFTIGLFSGVGLLATLTGLSPETIQILIGVAAGVLLSVTAIYVYLLAQQPPRRKPPVRRQVQPRRYPIKLTLLAGRMALAGGVA